MRIVRLFIISVIVLFGALVVISFLLPPHIRISRIIGMSSSKRKVFDQVNDLRSWDKWNQFTSQSGLTHKVFSNPSSGYQAYMQCDQLNVTITDSKPDSIKTSWHQTSGKNFTGGFDIVEVKPDTVVVQWYFDFYFRWYPWQKISSIVYDKQLGPVMEESLTNLKHLAESNP